MQVRMQVPSVYKYLEDKHHVQVSTEDKHYRQSAFVQLKHVFVPPSG